MKKVAIMLLWSIVLTGIIATSAFAVVNQTFSPSSGNANPGANLVIDVILTGPHTVWGVDSYLKYDNTIFDPPTITDNFISASWNVSNTLNPVHGVNRTQVSKATDGSGGFNGFGSTASGVTIYRISFPVKAAAVAGTVTTIEADSSFTFFAYDNSFSDVTGASSKATFTVQPAGPSFVSIAPNNGYRTQTVPVTITGSGTHFDGTTTVSLGDANITVNSIVANPSGLSLTCNLVIGASATLGAHNVVVTTGGEIVTGTNVFTVNGPTFLTIAPSSGNRSQTVPVTITGGGTHFDGTTTVSLGDANITVNSIVPAPSGLSLTCNLVIGASATLGTHNVVVTTGGEIVTGTNAFTVNPAGAPSFVSIVPSTGTVGTTVPVTITGMNTNFDGTTTVSLGDANITVNSIVANPSGLSLTCNLVIGASATLGAHNVVVTTGAEIITGTAAFTVNTTPPPPTPGPVIYERSGGIMVAYPNPFNPNTQTIKMLFGAVTGEAVDIYILDTNARVIWQYKDAQLAADRIVEWDGKTSFGETVDNGFYIVRVVKDAKLVAKGKILVIKK